MDKTNLILIDFSWLYNRYYFIASQRVSNSEIGEELYSMLFSFFSLVSDKYWSSNTVSVLDSATKSTKGYLLNNNYKQNRDKGAKKEVYKHLRDIVARLSSELPLNCSFLRAPNKEADEIIAFQVKKYSENYNIIIYSGDKDLLQLTAYPNTYVSDKFAKGEFLLKTDKDIFEKFKNTKGEDFTRISTNKKDILKYRVLRGDSSDNLPPVFPRIKDKEIIDIIHNYWISEEKLTKEIIDDILVNVRSNNEILANKLEAGSNTWLTNYKIMDLYDVDTIKLRRLGGNK